MVPMHAQKPRWLPINASGKKPLNCYKSAMSTPARISYVIIAVLLALVGLLHLATLALTTLFGYFALRQFSFGRSKALGVALYLIAVGAVGYGLFYFSRQAYIALPRIAETTIPAVVGYAEKQDRKSTRLNSSHDQISYAVFCLKKKKEKRLEY